MTTLNKNKNEKVKKIMRTEIELEKSKRNEEKAWRKLNKEIIEK